MDYLKYSQTSDDLQSPEVEEVWQGRRKDGEAEKDIFPSHGKDNNDTLVL